MTKTSTLKTFIQIKNFTSHNWFQSNCYYIQIWPLVFDISNEFFLNPYWSKKFIKLLAKAWSIIFVASDKPIVSCLSYQSNPNKLVTRANISCAPLDIHKLKLVFIDIQFANFGTCFIFSTKLSNISWKFCFL